MDNKTRSLVKSVTYRIIAFFVLGTIIWITTRNGIQTTGITIAFSIIQVSVYYLHERLWERTDWGKEEQNQRNVALLKSVRKTHSIKHLK